MAMAMFSSTKSTHSQSHPCQSEPATIHPSVHVLVIRQQHACGYSAVERKVGQNKLPHQLRVSIVLFMAMAMSSSTKMIHSQSHPCQRQARDVACKPSASSHLACAMLGERCSASSERQIAPSLLRARGHGHRHAWLWLCSVARSRHTARATRARDEHVTLHVSHQLPHTSPAQCLANGAQHPANGKSPRHCYEHEDTATDMHGYGYVQQHEVDTQPEPPMPETST